MSRRLLFALSTSALILSGCASGSFKARQEQREKMAASTGMFCEFLSGDVYHDLDVELSMKMANRCDANRNFSITNYKNTSDQNGVIYCCATSGRAEKKAAVKKAPVTTPSKQEAEQSDAEVISE
ncbi:hypothetical protein AB1A81_14695 [Bdellovibrio bacteriovorus]|uniref:hypothetical protein n=1 Tax=Bdellovibrio bacteriovorus TaxID=959 RepID=UPI00031636F7|nr:hypothetical protein [Bdellovibrio bacteriovorus]AHZ83585.1 hypothetical protein EP01_01290 [Bdellovibrio bacteriovorus]BEV69555.1 hypothetical protein Bb109J_c2975 [Bdellovibrio bacteriovorus]